MYNSIKGCDEMKEMPINRQKIYDALFSLKEKFKDFRCIRVYIVSAPKIQLVCITESSIRKGRVPPSDRRYFEITDILRQNKTLFDLTEETAIQIDFWLRQIKKERDAENARMGIPPKN